LNVRLEFGKGRRPATKKGTKQTQPENSECLIKVYATKAMEAGTELLATYGDAYWK
jgi:hypothetical protein